MTSSTFTGRKVPRPTCRVTWAIFTPASCTCCRSSFVKCSPAVGAAALPSCFAFTALGAALREGDAWRQALLARLRGNRDQVSRALDAMGLPHSHPQATFLTWIDARRLAARVGDVTRWFEAHGVGLSDGADFAAPGFVRLNFATAPSLLATALQRMQRAVASLDRG